MRGEGRPGSRSGRVLRALGLVGLGAALAGTGAAAALWLGGEPLLYRARGGERLARACTPALLAALRDRGFEPADVEFGPDPKVSSPFSHPRSFGASFTFRDGAAETRVDGVMACAVSDDAATVDVRVSAPPRRAA